MYISELLIEDFGGLQNKKIAFESGLNLISGTNESGKSTACAFIKFVFYGFAGSSEQSRHTSLATGRACGSLIIVSDGKKYRIQRNGKVVSVYDEQTGSEFTDWKITAATPGEYFLGIPEKLYTRSVYVSQSEGARLDGTTGDAIRNLLLTGDEVINLRKAKKTLDDARKALKLKKGAGGKIHDCEQRISSLNIRLSNALQAKNDTELLSTSLAEEKIRIENLKAELDTARAAMARSRALMIRSSVDKLDAAGTELSRQGILLEGLIESNTVNGFIPDNDYENQLLTLEKEVSIYEKELTRVESQITAMQNELDARPPVEYEKYKALGKKEAIMPAYERNLSRFKLFNMLFFISCFIFVVSGLGLLASLLGLTSTSNKVIPFLLSASVITGILFGILRIFPKKKLNKIAAELLATDKKTPADICRECDEYETKVRVSSTKYLLQSYEDAKNAVASKKEKLKALLLKWNKSSISQAITDYRAFSEKRNSLEQKISELKNEISVAKASLSGFSESELATARALSPEDIKQGEAVTDEQIGTLEELLEAATEHKNELDLTLAASGATAEDIEALISEIESEKALLAKYEEKHSALILALDSLEEAENVIRSTVSPYLSTNATKYFDRITQGKYAELKLDSEMKLSYLKSDTDALTDGEYMSMGSSDLAWICLRLALHKRLSEKENIPLILDEALVYFDENRLALILDELYAASLDGTQIILTSASSREMRLLGGKAEIIEI